MSGRGKRKEEEGASDDNSDGHAPPKKASKTDSANDSDDIVVCEISKNRRVTVRNWQGKVWIDIREFYLKDGKQLPGKKGPYSGIFGEEASRIGKALYTWGHSLRVHAFILVLCYVSLFPISTLMAKGRMKISYGSYRREPYEMQVDHIGMYLGITLKKLTRHLRILRSIGVDVLGCSSRDFGSYGFVFKDVGYGRQMSFLWLFEVDTTFCLGY
ncbi:hypothetical protein GH714_022084 [Hevea brasiliensis]|uniref:Transcriptional coactivator p15 (PC4) C-terminal domain-containing protein n=1 Tax=Hevea brasiliensis TaxID=3981 RepID=A0A6A6K8V6_HEVBR|nr:hypothetical protein GH714_022084 [Hevea brasiliensis]